MFTGIQPSDTRLSHPPAVQRWGRYGCALLWGALLWGGAAAGGRLGLPSAWALDAAPPGAVQARSESKEQEQEQQPPQQAPQALLPPSWQEPDWSVGWYAGRHHDTEPAGALAGRAHYQDHYMLAVTGTKTLWKSDRWPVSIELDGMLGQQWGLAPVTEVAIAPALRWSGLPWRDVLRTDVRLAPLGYSYTSQVGPLERGPDGQGSRSLNFLFVEVAVSHPQTPHDEWFMRLHHRCAIYDLLNNYGANGEDFLTFGFRKRF